MFPIPPYAFGNPAAMGGFVGPLDTLIAQGASLVAAYSVRRLLATYNGSAIRIRGNGTGSPEADIGFTSTGDLDTTAVAAAIAAGGGSAGFFRTWYDQTSNARDANQAAAAIQPTYGAGTHNKGAAIGDGNSVKMDTASFTLSQPFTVFVIYNRTAGALSSALFGPISGPGATNSIYDNNPQWVAFYGSFINGAAADPTDGVWQSLTACINSASSSLRVNAGTAVTGNVGTQTPSGIRLLGRADGASGWRGPASEFIVFSGDPTGLAGWSAFRSSALSYFTP